ncbi:dual specificity protein phosphatase 19-like isoform X2 [Micropterus dolomieu]|uniref:dual specificity protein phosphatase 19-like isoform X2 n=1 Tax=Micropterus dolomieu TaxID=147949 RepID=UPI001E8E838F|nr:dual specificity protein phosphatase 19-like isoform X2 [Micropterus dolomieu]
MHSLAQEIQGFSKNRLKKQCTHVTTVTGRKLLERRSDGGEGEEQVEELEEGSGCGFVEDTSLDLQVGAVRPFLLLGSQDAAHDIDTLQRHKVSHVLNVAYGVTNLFPDRFLYNTLQILDLPDTDITSYIGECSSFIDQAREQGFEHSKMTFHVPPLCWDHRDGDLKTSADKAVQLGISRKICCYQGRCGSGPL